MAYRMIGPYLSTVLEFYERGKKHGGKHGAIWSLFANEENVKQVALEALFQLFGSAESRHHYNSLAGAIAKRAEYVLWLNHPDMEGWHLQGLRLASSNDLGMKNMMARLRDKGFRKAASYQALGRLERVALGAFFIEAIAASTQMFEVTITNDYRGRPFKSVKATELYWDFLKRWKRNLLLFRHVHMPMIQQPRPYTEYADGGYLTIETSWTKIPWESYPAHVRDALPCVLGAVNKLQSICFNLDIAQLSLLRWAWESGHEVGAVPSQVRWGFVSFNEVLAEHGRTEAWRRVWRVKNDRTKDAARAKMVNTFVAVDRLDGQGLNRLWWVWHADSRGRLYPRGSQINFQGPDPHRSMILFDHGAPIKGNVTEFAWAVGDAIGLPPDRAYRADWFQQHNDSVFIVGDNPQENLRLWADKKKPWRYVQLCREWRRYIADPGYITRVPFQLDQTTSGYGHVACLTRDARLAEWSNVTGHAPSDLYTRVGDIVKKLTRESYDKCGDELTKKYLSWWLENWPTRSLLKKAIMPIIYGRRYLSMQHEIAEHLVAQFCHSQSPEGYQAMALASVLARQILLGAGQSLPNVLELSRWLNRAGSALIRQGIRPYWYTPNGLKVESYSSLTRKKAMRLVLSGKTVKIQVRDGDGEPLAGKVSHLAADYVHSMDAAFLQRFVHDWPHQIVTVHDCFATTLDKVGQMRSDLNTCFNRFYQRDYLYEHWRETAGYMLNLPQPPSLASDRQALDVRRIGENPFLFT